LNNHFTVTIEDDKGVREFNLHKLIKKIIIYILLFILVSSLVGVGTILYLNSTLDNIKQKRLILEHNYNALKKKNSKLLDDVSKTRLLLIAKKKEFHELSDSLSEIEILIGLTPAPDASLQERVNTTKLTSRQIAILLKYIPNGSPVKYKGITSKFGYRIHPILHKREFHSGTDLKAKYKTPVYATADGIIEWAAMHKKSGYGKLVIIEHNYGFKTYFGHLSKIVVKPREFVKKGELIAYTGNSGLSNGPHLHYEIRFMGRVVNPYWFIKWNVNNNKEIFSKEKKIPWHSLITAMSEINQIRK